MVCGSIRIHNISWSFLMHTPIGSPIVNPLLALLFLKCKDLRVPPKISPSHTQPGCYFSSEADICVMQHDLQCHAAEKFDPLCSDLRCIAIFFCKIIYVWAYSSTLGVFLFPGEAGSKQDSNAAAQPRPHTHAAYIIWKLVPRLQGAARFSNVKHGHGRNQCFGILCCQFWYDGCSGLQCLK